jgi:hypothetical protein
MRRYGATTPTMPPGISRITGRADLEGIGRETGWHGTRKTRNRAGSLCPNSMGGCVEGSSCTNAALMKPEAWPQTQLQPIRYNHREKRAFYGAV